MKKMLDVIYILLLFSLNVACSDKKQTEGIAEQPDLASVATMDTLKFTSGIRAIFQDSKGNYWFGSTQEGVAVYNGKVFTYFSTNEGLTDNQIHSIQEDKEGTIWFNTQMGVSSYDGYKIRNRTQAEGMPIADTTPSQEAGTSHEAWMKTDGDLWFEAGNNQGVYRFDGENLIYLAFPNPKSIDPFNVYAVTDISTGKNNMTWFGTFAGVFGYDGNNFTIINNETLGYDVKVMSLHIRSILEDSKGRLWIGNNGIGVLLKEGETISQFSEKKKLIHPSSTRRGDQSMPGTLEHVFTIAEDRLGNIWFGDRDAGVWKFDGTTMTNYTQKDGLLNDFALAIYEDNAGTLWFGMNDGSIYTFNGEGFEKQF